MSRKLVSRLQLIITHALIFIILAQSAGAVLPPAVTTGQATSAAATAVQPAALAEQLAAAPNTIEINPEAITPEMLEVMVGEAITIVNNDSRARTIRLSSEDDTGDFQIFLPLVLRLATVTTIEAQVEARSAASAGGTAEAADDETITLEAGESVQRTFDQTGNLVARDAENPALAATILVTPRPLASEGTADGKVIDYESKAAIEGAQVKALNTDFQTTTDAQGEYSLLLPPGDYTLVMFANGYTFANRQIRVQAFSPVGAETVELTPLDPTVTAIGSAGGNTSNSTGETDVAFAAGAITSTKAVRLTVLEVDEFDRDFAALPGPFTDGNIPLGFVSFEPDGTTFEGDAVWTIDYDGPLPVGTFVPCYYWLEDQARWGEPVDGYVVDLGNGQKGLRATLPHFSAYGFSAPPPPDPEPPDPPDDAPDDDGPHGPEDHPETDDNDSNCGSQINLMSGQLCQTIGTLGLPSVGGLPTQISAKYRSLDLNSTISISTTFKQKTGSATPDEESWRFEIAGRTFSGQGRAVDVAWDGRDGEGNLLPPGIHQGLLTSRWEFNTSSGWVIYETPVTWTVKIRRDDLSPFGRGWFGPHDTLLVDRGDSVTIIQGDGRHLVFSQDGKGVYQPPEGDFSTLTRDSKGVWTRSYRDGSSLQFNADGRLIQISDRYGNSQRIFYENSQGVADGQWGQTTRIRRVSDSSGNTFDYAYKNGWLALITDSAGRNYVFEHDAEGFLTAFVDPLGQREEFTYNERGMMTSHTDRRGFTTTYVLDEQGRLVSRSWPSGTDLHVSYSERQVDWTLDNGSPVVTTLDDNFSPVARYNGVYTATTTYSDELLPQTRTHAPLTTLYDEHGNVIEAFAATSAWFEYDGPFEQVSRATSSDGNDTQFNYDTQGNLTSFSDVLGQTYSLTYDEHGQPLTITDPLGHTTSLTYDTRGQVESLTDALGRTWHMGYDAAGNLTGLTDAEGRTSSLGYDDLNRLTDILDALNGTTVMGYDANGNLTSITDPSGRIISYAYDSLDRLTGISYADGGQESFAYDPIGNLTGFTDARGQVITWGYDAANRVTQKDVQGGATATYRYDDLDQLTGLSDGTISTTLSYIPDTVGYPLRETQIAPGLPLTVTISYGYSNGTLNGGRFDTSQSVIPPNSVSEAAETQPPPLTAANPLIETSGAELSPPIAASPLAVTPSLAPETPPAADDVDVIPTHEDGAAPAGPLATAVDVSGEILTDTTWVLADSPYVLTADLIVPPTYTLTIEPGVVVMGQLNTELKVLGHLQARGTPSQPITFTSATDSGPNQWTGLVFDGGTGDLRQVTVRYGGYKGNTIMSSDFGGTDYRGSNIAIRNVLTGEVRIENSRVTDEYSHFSLHRIDYGLYANNSQVVVNNTLFANNGSGTDDYALYATGANTVITVTNSTFQNNAGYGLYTAGDALPWVTDSAFSDNGAYPLRSSANNLHRVLSGNTFSSNSPNRLLLTAGSLGTDLTISLSNGLTGYELAGDLTVPAGLALTVEPGVVVMGRLNAELKVLGHLQAIGTPSQPITFTSATDSGPNQWTGLVFDGGTGDLRQVTVRYGGYKGNTIMSSDFGGNDYRGSNIAIRNVLTGEVRIENSRVTDEYSHFGLHRTDYGLYVKNGQVVVNNTLFANNGSGTGDYALYATGANTVITVTGSVFRNNPGYALYNNTPITVEASLNYWGAASGPYHPTLNPAGTGQRVGDGVDFYPWRAAYPLPGDGRLSDIQLISNDNRPQVEQFQYDAIGRLTQLRSSGYSTYTLVYSYDAANRLTARSPVAGVPLSTIYAYDAADQLTQLTLTGPGGTLINEIYSYDAVGNVTSVVSGRNGTIDYTYDDLDRLTSVSGPGLNETYTYDAAGNRLSAGGTTFSYDAGGRLVSSSDGVTYGYDAAGNLTSKTGGGQTTAYTWDAQNRLARIAYPDGSFSAYRYDDYGRRISKRSPDGTTTYYVYNGLNLAQELDSSGAVIASYTYDGLDRPVTMWRDGQTYTYLLDRLGSVLGLVDESGALVISYQYDPWGNVISSTGALTNPLRFTSREFDEESGLYFYRARYYDPQVGRFISRDPIGMAGGLNQYAYVGSNPVNLIDPFGLFSWVELGREIAKGLGTAAGGAAGAYVGSKIGGVSGGIIGGLLGSGGGPIGAGSGVAGGYLVGSLVGGSLGAIIGGATGGYLAEDVYDWMIDDFEFEMGEPTISYPCDDE